MGGVLCFKLRPNFFFHFIEFSLQVINLEIKMALAVTRHETSAFKDQKAGTSGLRKATTVFQQAHYVENFIQSYFNALNEDIVKELGANARVSLMLGGDGRFFGLECVSRILKLAAANPHIEKVIVAQNGVMSTPAVSACIRKYKTYGGMILTASHNPGGPNADFGIKFNNASGGPTLAHFTDKVFTLSTKITHYDICQGLECSVDKISEFGFQVQGNDGVRNFTVQVIDSVNDYLELMKEIFDFDALRGFFKSGVKITVNALNGGKFLNRYCAKFKLECLINFLSYGPICEENIV